MMGRKRRKFQLSLSFCLHLNACFSKALGLNVSNSISIGSFYLVETFVKIMCCMFDQSYIQPLTENLAERLRLLVVFRIIREISSDLLYSFNSN